MILGKSLVTTGLVKKYGRTTALDGFTLAVPTGSVLGLVGPNGSGKTTWMMCVAGLLKVKAGTVEHSGRLGLLPQDSELPLEMSPRALLAGYARLAGKTAKAADEAARAILKKVNLADRMNASVKSLSHGMRKRVMTAQCFVDDPDILLLDEPMNGLDPEEAERLRNLILEGKGRRTTVISSHNLIDLERLCTHVAFVERGRVTRMGSLAELTSDGQSLEALYLNRNA